MAQSLFLCTRRVGYLIYTKRLAEQATTVSNLKDKPYHILTKGAISDTYA